MEVNQNGEYLKKNNQKFEIIKICERCKNRRANLYCERCKPFHYFCNQCDTSIHELPLRKIHCRIPIEYFRNSLAINEDVNKNISSNRYYSPRNYSYKSLSLNNNINYNNDIYNYKFNNDNNEHNNSISYVNKTLASNSPNNGFTSERYTYAYNINGIAKGIEPNENRKIYSKDYVNELNIMHDKEKEGLKYKITTLENTVNRLKSSLNEQLTNMKRTHDQKENESNDKIDQIKRQYQLTISNMEREKDSKEKEITDLKQKLSEQLKINAKVLSSFEELKTNYYNLQKENNSLNKNYTMIEDISKKEKENLNQKILASVKELENYKEKAKADIQNLINSNNKNLNDLIKQKEIEIKELNIKHEENLKNQSDFLTAKYERIINELNNENNILRQDNVILVQKIDNTQQKINEEKELYNKNLNELENENLSKNENIKDLQKQLDEMNYNNKELEKVINDLNNQNNELKKNMNEHSKEKEDLEEKILMLNNELKSAQATNEVISRKINILKEDYKKIKVNYDSVNLECDNKLRNTKFIEERNNMLESENEKLKNKIDNYMKPKSFSYVYAQK